MLPARDLRARGAWGWESSEGARARARACHATSGGDGAAPPPLGSDALGGAGAAGPVLPGGG